MTAAWVTADTPRWLFFLMLGAVVAAYVGCGLLVVGSRYRRARRARAASPVTSRNLPPARGLVITVPAPEEVTR